MTVRLIALTAMLSLALPLAAEAQQFKAVAPPPRPPSAAPSPSPFGPEPPTLRLEGPVSTPERVGPAPQQRCAENPEAEGCKAGLSARSPQGSETTTSAPR